MAIKKIDKVSCSLNLGLIYQLQYSFVPQEGVKIQVFFVNETGKYNTKNILSTTQKQQIKIGKALFNLYPVSYNLQSSENRKVISVNFVDETFKLNNYYIGLTGRAKGDGVYTLGKSVDKRTDIQKKQEDPDLFTIRSFTSFDDVEYSFAEFLAVLKTVFPVESLSAYDSSLTRDFTGTFKSVLENWCSYYSLTYFFENSVLKIVNPASLNIKLPECPSDALDYNVSETLENTFNKTVWNRFSAEGGEITVDSYDPSLIITLSLYPYEDLFEIKQLEGQVDVDKGQVVAAQYGKEFWFLYNYNKGTAESICGWKNVTATGVMTSQIKSGLNSGAQIALLDQALFEKNYEFYKTYGDRLAGRVYVSNPYGDTNQFNGLEFYEQGGKSTVNVEKFTLPLERESGVISNTTINEAFQGIFCNKNRLYYIDETPKDLSSLFIDESTRSKINYYYKNLIEGLFGSEAYDFGDNQALISYFEQNIESSIKELFKDVFFKEKLFGYRYKISNLVALKPLITVTAEFNPLNKTNVTILPSDKNYTSNTSLMKAAVGSDVIVYYSKYEDCKANSTSEPNLFSRKFEPREISNDIPIKITASKKTAGVTEIIRDFSYFETVSESNILEALAQSFTINQKTVEFSLNYFSDNIPNSFLSNGLVGIDVSVQGDSITASYRYSNEMLNVPVPESAVYVSEQNIRNSWISKYNPVIKKGLLSEGSPELTKRDSLLVDRGALFSERTSSLSDQ